MTTARSLPANFTLAHCSLCDSTGLVTIEFRRGLDLDTREEPCPDCEPDEFSDEGRYFGDSEYERASKLWRDIDVDWRIERVKGAA